MYSYKYYTFISYLKSSVWVKKNYTKTCFLRTYWLKELKYSSLSRHCSRRTRSALTYTGMIMQIELSASKCILTILNSSQYLKKRLKKRNYEIAPKEFLEAFKN